MTTQMITLKLDDGFLKDIDRIVKKEGYQNRTEFIRSSLREKVEHARLRESIEKLRGSVKRKTTDEEYERARQQAFDEISRRLG